MAGCRKRGRGGGARARVLAVAAALAGVPAIAPAQEPAAPEQFAVPGAPETAAPPVARQAPSRVRIVVDGMPAAGLQVRLRAEGTGGEGARYRWVQTGGPPVTLDDAAGAAPRFIVPDAAGTLEFLLAVSTTSGLDTVTVAIPVEGRTAASGLRADAGDDQLGVVGRRVTLNGLRSGPRGRIGYRWIQVAGPPVLLRIEDGPLYSFAPTEPGVYRFALVVASGGAISEADCVAVTVGPAPTAAPAPPATLPPPPTPAQLAGSALAALHGGTEAADELAATFDQVAGRIDLYACYADLYSELSRRLEPALPGDPAERRRWDETLFAPLTAQLIEALRREGLDLRTEADRTAPLTTSQRRQLAVQFRAMADGFRGTLTPR